MNSRHKKRHHKINYLNLIILIIIFGIVIYGGIKLLSKFVRSDVNVFYEIFNQEEIENQKKIEKFNDCMSEKFDNTSDTLLMKSEREALDSYMAKYDVSVLYKDIKTANSYYYNKDEIYYSASTIKIVDALYVYENAFKGIIDLNAPLTKIRTAGLFNSENINYQNVNTMPVKDVVKYLVTVSDNRAHQLLVYNFGSDKIGNYAADLGADYHIYQDILFTNIDLHDAEIYLNKLYEFVFIFFCFLSAALRSSISFIFWRAICNLF
jgi:hypothetical protein